MDNTPGILWEVGIWEFAFVTVILSGSAAYVTGRAVARAWLANWQLVAYVLALGLATRFIHFALFGGSLLSPYYYLIDIIVLLAFAFTGLKITRTRQMAQQYGFEFVRSGLFGWHRRATPP